MKYSIKVFFIFSLAVLIRVTVTALIIEWVVGMQFYDAVLAALLVDYATNQAAGKAMTIHAFSKIKKD